MQVGGHGGDEVRRCCCLISVEEVHDEGVKARRKERVGREGARGHVYAFTRREEGATLKLECFLGEVDVSELNSFRVFEDVDERGRIE